MSHVGLSFSGVQIVLEGLRARLRDNMHGNKIRVLDYVKSLRRNGVSSVITLYAVEDLKGKERKEVLNVKPSQAAPKKG